MTGGIGGPTLPTQPKHFHHVAEFGKSEALRLGLQLDRQTKIETFRSVAFPADKMMVMVVGFRQFKETAQNPKQLQYPFYEC